MDGQSHTLLTDPAQMQALVAIHNNPGLCKMCCRTGSEAGSMNFSGPKAEMDAEMDTAAPVAKSPGLEM